MHALTPDPALPDPALVARFRTDFESIAGRPPDSGRKLGLGVSGGPDSMAMLLLAAAAYPGDVLAATVNHGLRPEAADEVVLVSALCARLGVPHTLLTLPDDHVFTGNLQDGARSARYLALQRWALPHRAPQRVEWIAVAHHCDDVAEGFLMRARRGSGVGGLAAMRSARRMDDLQSLSLVRPLLEWSRSSLAAIVETAGVRTAQDPSNLDPRYDRSRMRQLIANNPELPPARLARAAQNLRHAEEAIEWCVLRELRARFEEDDQGNLWLDPTGLPYELRRRFLHRAVEGIRRENNLFENWREDGLDRLLATLDSGRSGTIADVQARPIAGRWHFRLAPARRSH